MNAVREFPPNPHALVIHTDELITEQIVETFLPDSTIPPPEWVQDALALPGVRVLSLNAYKIRLQKTKDAGWQPILGAFEAILRDRLGIRHIDDLVEGESPRRVFAWHGPTLARRVYEGRSQAGSDGVAAALFELTGVAEVILDGHRVQVRKCPLCSWRELSPAIEQLLRDA